MATPTAAISAAELVVDGAEMGEGSVGGAVAELLETGAVPGMETGGGAAMEARFPIACERRWSLVEFLERGRVHANEREEEEVAGEP